MYRSTYLREVRKEKYERSDALDEQSLVDFGNLGLAQVQGLQNLQELNERFSNYINRARVLEQRNAIFRKQLETFQRMDEISGLEEAFEEQIELNRQRIRELTLDHAKLEREYKDAQRMVDEFRNKYKNECDYQLMLRETLDRLNRCELHRLLNSEDADEALLCNLELQIESQFLQDDINATKDRYKKNLMEIQTYVNILQQIIQTTPRVTAITGGTQEEKVMSERRIPILQSQLEEYKSILCQLQAQKHKLQSETTMLEQAIKNTQESYDDEIQLYNEQIDTLRKGLEEGERSLEKYTNDCRQLIIYQQSLENELERNKRIIENEDNRLNSAIVGSPITLFTQSFRSAFTQATRTKDLSMAIQDIATAKPRQKGLPKKALRKRDVPTGEKIDMDDEGQAYTKIEGGLDEKQGTYPYERHSPNHTGSEEIKHHDHDLAPEDVPDGAQISKAFNHLCSLVRDRVKVHKRPEPATEYFTRGRYVLVTGESSYVDPYFFSCSPQAGGGITVIISNNGIPAEHNVLPIPEEPEPCEPSVDDEESSSDDSKQQEPENQKKTKKDDDSDKTEEQDKKSDDKHPDPKDDPRGPSGAPTPESSSSEDQGGTHNNNNSSMHKSKGKSALKHSDTARQPGSMSYEKVEVVESIEKFSDDRIQTYEETAVIVETTIEKTTKKKQGEKSS